MDEGQKHIIHQRIQNIEQIFANICEYSMTNSLLSRGSIADEGGKVSRSLFKFLNIFKNLNGHKS